MPHLWFLDLGNNNFSGQVPVGWGMKGITWILTSKGARHNHSWWCFPAQSMRALPYSQAHAGLALPAGHLHPLHEGAKPLRISAIPALSLVLCSCLMGLEAHRFLPAPQLRMC